MTERGTNHIPREQRVGAIAFPASDAGNDAEPGGAPSWPAELPELRRALAKSQRETHAARIVIRKLQEINSRLKRELARLEQNQVTALALACYDELTGLPNRRLLRDRLRQTIAQGIRHDKQVALLLIDLDGFKRINDRLGHAAGDRLLQAIAKRLADSIRVADTACRYGGDEFVVLLSAVDHPALAAAVAGKIRQRLAEPYLIYGFEIRMTASVGAVFYPEDGRRYAELLSKADNALYRAKATSRKASIRSLQRVGPAPERTAASAAAVRPRIPISFFEGTGAPTCASSAS